ncbi:DUF2163 domain-containing protein [Mesorhizobium qingshengii]|uniref:DUF2163 domain-containing protein n=1 Tax=Mesorhizobium qingshengii TaxID=1165689 RepID=A0A1G5UZP2_9HYPH|nr:DUF2163 domain-containing protein [Mesorhizobium qingshengii]SDA39092.1 hypothetical protein SAMN02927914_00109 [Mesorhizobium qingshengii]
MSTSLDPAVQALVDDGQFVRLDLVRFDLAGKGAVPPKTVGYHRGGRPFTFNGLTYLPNRWLAPGAFTSAVGPSPTKRTIVFSYAPTVNPDDAIATIRSYNYLNAPVIITVLAGDPATDQVAGVLTSIIYRIDAVRFPRGAADKNGQRSLTVEIDLVPPGRSVRGSTLVKISPADQNFDNDPADTSLEYVATNAKIQEEWGQRSG